MKKSATNMPVKFEKPRIAVVWPSETEGNKKLTLTVPGKNVGYITVMSHESLSVMRSWCNANGYQMDISRVDKPVKPKYVAPDDSDDYQY